MLTHFHMQICPTLFLAPHPFPHQLNYSNTQISTSFIQASEKNTELYFLYSKDPN